MPHIEICLSQRNQRLKWLLIHSYSKCYTNCTVQHSYVKKKSLSTEKFFPIINAQTHEMTIADPKHWNVSRIHWQLLRWPRPNTPCWPTSITKLIQHATSFGGLGHLLNNPANEWRKWKWLCVLYNLKLWTRWMRFEWVRMMVEFTIELLFDRLLFENGSTISALWGWCNRSLTWRNSFVSTWHIVMHILQ